jgi:hypothetical protein
MERKYNNKQLQDWWIKTAQTATGYRRNIIANHERKKDVTVIGKMYFFYYDPKFKKILPIYDRFPLVFPIEGYPDGFLGLNLHYLSIEERQFLLNLLQSFSNNKKYDETTRLKLSYDLLTKSKTILGAIRPCIKRYLFGHVQSPFIEIHAHEWDKVIELPVELFVRKG